MAIVQGITAAAVFAGVAVAAASPIWADLADEMSGTYTAQSPNDLQFSTWTITPCGSTCLNVTSSLFGGTRQAQVSSTTGEWTFSLAQVICPDGSFVPGSTTYEWIPETRTGTRTRSSNGVPVCGRVSPIDDVAMLTLTKLA